MEVKGQRLNNESEINVYFRSFVDPLKVNYSGKPALRGKKEYLRSIKLK